MSMLKKLSAIGAELESPADPTQANYGVAATVANDDLFLCYDLNFVPGIESLGRPVYRSTLTPAPPVPGAKVSAVDFKVQPVGSGTAGTLPPIDKLLKACGYKVTTDTGKNNLYHPFDPSQGVDDHDSITLKIYQAGLAHVLNGCRGTFSIGQEVGQMLHFDFHFEGITFTYIDEAFPTSGTAFSTLNPPVCLNTGCALDTALLNIPSVTLDMAQTLTRILSLNSVDGTSEIYISERMGVASLEPAATLVATSPELYTKWAAGSKMALLNTIGTVAGNQVVIAVPRLVQTSLAFGERDGLLTNTLSATMTGPINTVTGTADSGSTTTIVDAAVVTADNEYDGCVLEITSGANSGKKRLISSTDLGTTTMTFAPALGSAISTDTYTIHKWEIGIDFR